MKREDRGGAIDGVEPPEQKNQASAQGRKYETLALPAGDVWFAGSGRCESHENRDGEVGRAMSGKSLAGNGYH